MRRAKIVATLGPASSEPPMIEQLLEAGVDVVRLNFSHGTHPQHARSIERIRAAAERLGRPVAVLQDLQGPKIRIGPLAAGASGVELRPGGEIVVTTEREVAGDERMVSTSYPHLAADVSRGDRLLVDDGRIELRVVHTDGVRARCEVVTGGVLYGGKGINLPGVALRAPAVGEKDERDLAFGLAHGVDFVALSFVRTAADVELCRGLVRRHGRDVPVIAKIEKPEAVERLDAIVRAADGVLVARGDLGVEMAPERVPPLQKEIVHVANAAGKPAIVATQMLESMIEHPRPTRAEASDVANAVWDGADAVMLSGETAVGRHPVAAVHMMDRIVRRAEEAVVWSDWRRSEPASPATLPEVVASAACRAAADAGATAICCFTLSGTTARLVSRFRPPVPIVGFSTEPRIRARLALLWGVVPRALEPVADPDEMSATVAEQLLADGAVRPGDRLVIVFGSPLGVSGSTNSLRLHEVGDRPRRAPAPPERR